MKSKLISQPNTRFAPAPQLAGLVCAASLLLCATLLHAQMPPNPLVELSFSEGIGSTTATNTGTLGGYAILQLTDSINDPDLILGGEDPDGNPYITNNVPVGPYAPTNQYSVNNGNPTGASGDGTGTGGWQVNLTNTPFKGA